MYFRVSIVEIHDKKATYWIILIFIIQFLNIALLTFSLAMPWISETFFTLQGILGYLSVDVWGRGILVLYRYLLVREVFSFSVGYFFVYGITILAILASYSIIIAYTLYNRLSYGRIGLDVFRYIILINLLGFIIVILSIIFVVFVDELPVSGLPNVSKLGDLNHFGIDGNNVYLSLSLGGGFWAFLASGVLMIANFLISLAFKNRFYESLLKSGV